MNDRASLAEKIGAQFHGRVRLLEDEQIIEANSDILLDLLTLLKQYGQFSMLLDVTAADYENYLEVVYHVLLEEAKLVRVKVRVENETPVVPSVISIWKSADVMEREVFDMLGIVFTGHGNLKRILCPDEFVHHPLRKAFKLDIVDRFS